MRYRPVTAVSKFQVLVLPTELVALVFLHQREMQPFTHGLDPASALGFAWKLGSKTLNAWAIMRHSYLFDCYTA